jgi:hypothetical protein
MRKILLALVLATVAAPAFAQGADGKNGEVYFYQKRVSQSMGVFGTLYPPEENGRRLNPDCSIQLRYTDGSFVQITKDLVKNELWINMVNVDWSLPKVEKPVRGLLNLYAGNKVVGSFAFDFIVINKSRIVIPAIVEKQFRDAFYKSNRYRMVMPGDAPNLGGSYGNSAVPLGTALSECVQEYAKNATSWDVPAKTAPKQAPATTVPRQPKKDEI